MSQGFGVSGPEPEPEPEPAVLETRAEGKTRSRIQGLSQRFEACTTLAAESKQSKKGRKGSSRPPPQSVQEAQQWLGALRDLGSLDLAAATATLAADGRVQQAPWAAAYFALLQRVVQSGPLAGDKPGRFRKSKPPHEPAEAAVACLTTAMEADRATEGRLLTEPQRSAIDEWLQDAARHFEKADRKPSDPAAAAAGTERGKVPAAGMKGRADSELAALAEGVRNDEGDGAAAAAERLRLNVAATMRTDGRKPRW